MSRIGKHQKRTDRCECGGSYYKGGFCFKCGKSWGGSSGSGHQKDLCNLMSGKEGYSIIYGFNLRDSGKGR